MKSKANKITMESQGYSITKITEDFRRVKYLHINKLLRIINMELDQLQIILENQELC